MKETVMKSRIPFSWTLMLVALVLSFVPAASIGTQSAAALPACDWAQFVADVTVPDGTTFAANATFTKTWRLKNIGFCTWTTSYALVFDSGNNMGGPTSVNLPSSVAPGQTVDLSVDLTAPSSPGHYIGYWKLMNASGVRFGIGANMNRPWWVEINVGSGSSGVAYDFAANYCDATWFSTAGNLPCPGSDGDPRGFVLKVDNPQLENGTTASGSGLITQPRNIFNGDIHGKFPEFHVQHGDRFQSIVNCSYGATGCYVTFRLDYQIGNGPIYTYWAFREKYEGLYYRADIDLNPLAGKDVKFILTVLASGPAGGDRALWSNPSIVRIGPPAPPPSTGTKFDFGTSSSPVAPGYTKVTETTTYSSGNFGWTSATGLESRDRNTQSDPLKRDFNMSSLNAGTFRVDIPNGYYAVTVTMGDQDYAHDMMVVKANGATVLASVDSALGGFTVNTFNVNVTGGNLQLEFSDAGGSDGSWIINAITIVPTTFSGDKFDFGTSTSPVAAGYTQVTENTTYSSGGFGWVGPIALESRDRSAPDDLKRDFNMSSSHADTFRDDVPNGTYAVTVTMGDQTTGHDMMVVKANGATVLGSVHGQLIQRQRHWRQSATGVFGRRRIGSQLGGQRGHDHSDDFRRRQIRLWHQHLADCGRVHAGDRDEWIHVWQLWLDEHFDLGIPRPKRAG
jgi:fibronectin type 3 domain-containing protein